LLRKQRKTLGGYFILPHPVHSRYDTIEDLQLSLQILASFAQQELWTAALPTCLCVSLFSLVRFGRVASTLSGGNRSSLLGAYSEGIRC